MYIHPELDIGVRRRRFGFMYYKRQVHPRGRVGSYMYTTHGEESAARSPGGFGGRSIVGGGGDVGGRRPRVVAAAGLTGYGCGGIRVYRTHHTRINTLHTHTYALGRVPIAV